MRVGAVSGGWQPYVYRTNAVNSSSLSKVRPIGNDLLASKTDFSGLTKEENNITVNPLKRGETANFADVLSMQMQMGRLNAQRVIKPDADRVEEDAGLKIIKDRQMTETTLYQARRAAESYGAGMNLLA